MDLKKTKILTLPYGEVKGNKKSNQHPRKKRGNNAFHSCISKGKENTNSQGSGCQLNAKKFTEKKIEELQWDYRRRKRGIS